MNHQIAAVEISDARTETLIAHCDNCEAAAPADDMIGNPDKALFCPACIQAGYDEWGVGHLANLEFVSLSPSELVWEGCL